MRLQVLHPQIQILQFIPQNSDVLGQRLLDVDNRLFSRDDARISFSRPSTVSPTAEQVVTHSNHSRLVIIRTWTSVGVIISGCAHHQVKPWLKSRADLFAKRASGLQIRLNRLQSGVVGKGQ